MRDYNMKDGDVGLWDIVLGGLVGRYQRFRGTYCLHVWSWIPAITSSPK
jgi:hypothetical protein